MSTASAMAAVAAERQRQDAQWGEQNHPDGTGPDWQVVGYQADDLLMMVRRALDAASKPTFRITYPTVDPFEAGEDAAEVARMHGASVAAVPPAGPTWLLIALEEAFEAFVETDEARLRAELVQLAAVAVAWIEAIDRRPAGPTTEDGDA